jgi:hypothetical protein
MQARNVDQREAEEVEGMCVAPTALVSAPSSPAAQSTRVFSPADDIIASGKQRQATRFFDGQETEREKEGLLVQIT